ncbi:hypothetical protein THRCLA_20734 [Thraustotheca clavata]|uniref:Uncharacterized protein n=1 Tax=Thraustotheca clavata TaxID=74557 RepID=A0A1W0A423_9STRA|nr:hypothetical protein THRCLA_20734 [Thraustotheca clavata]
MPNSTTSACKRMDAIALQHAPSQCKIWLPPNHSTYGCGAVETHQHAFHDCPRICTLWDFHSTALDCFGVDFNWSSISDLEVFMTNRLGSHHYDALYILWSLLVASLLHSIWVQHNFVQYEHRSPLSARTWTEHSFHAWTMSIGRWHRLQDPSCADRFGALDALRILQNQPNCRDLWTRYPHCLQL